MQRFSSVPCLNPCNYHTNFTADRKRSLTKGRLHDCAPTVPGKFIGMRDGNGIESGNHEALMYKSYLYSCGGNTALFCALLEMRKYSPAASRNDSTSATGFAQIRPVSWKIAPRTNIAGM